MTFPDSSKADPQTAPTSATSSLPATTGERSTRSRPHSRPRSDKPHQPLSCPQDPRDPSISTAIDESIDESHQDPTELVSLPPPNPDHDHDCSDNRNHSRSSSVSSISSGSVRLVVQRTASTEQTRRSSLETQGGHLGSLRRYWSRHVSLVVPRNQNRDHFGGNKLKTALERTFLAYIRTSLSFAFHGVLIAQLFSLQNRENHDTTFGFYTVGLPLACACHACAILVAAVGAYRFWRQQNALARGKVHAGGWELNLSGACTVGVSDTGSRVPAQPQLATMWMSKSHRIILLLVIDSMFFLLELIVGYSVHSLALIADSFHMLNDVLSLCVGLGAVKVANRKTSSKIYTYGWQRAETLGALVNGVFLVALCLSIFLEAIQRLVEPQEVRNPKLICVVGCFGLLSNFFGLVLFHEHSHGHGGHSDGHNTEEAVDTAEQGYAQEVSREAMSDESGTVVSAASGNVVANRFEVERGATKQKGSVENGVSNPARKRSNSRRFSSSGPRAFRDAEDIQIHPAILRRDIIEASRFDDETFSESDTESNRSTSERTGLLDGHNGATYSTTNVTQGAASQPSKDPHKDLHDAHNHAKPKSTEGKKGHSHSDLNMRGIFLHVVGDALGNFGVIASALIIWLTNYSWRFYADPAISLVITVIILASAIPLCKAASRILLQAVPADLSIDHIIEDIQDLPGVLSCHHLHVWQLSDTKLVCSLHIQVSHDIKGEGSDRYMELARQVRRCLHAYGIHSSTIQPEFYPGSDTDETSRVGSSHSLAAQGGQCGTARQRGPGTCVADANCLLECGVECAAGRQCCPGGK
ncbi:hypothetical protein PAAG_11159 [Paracoccidioides lutzii Pb01]|uniref:Uncharacterized protein n=1 Tax=Paracoccidioides lutzii (strain ATCC MYA-826 / Pb01) TaxID=502779 RepID=A0A0A2V2F7_PARBA|nr:hypothetical protein PAAG_11159 [Paracoccidioides lutzii Pb01]KGQ01986.1 hypothetical protein PAAG_11159 [Paracoccidioides lutzii Pb01]